MKIDWNIIINSFAGGGVAYLISWFIIKHWLWSKFQKDIEKYKAQLQIEVIEATQKIIIKQQHDKDAIKADRKLFEKFTKVLSDSNIKFLQDHDFGASFKRDNIEDFRTFAELWGKKPQIGVFR